VGKEERKNKSPLFCYYILLPTLNWLLPSYNTKRKWGNTMIEETFPCACVFVTTLLPSLPSQACKSLSTLLVSSWCVCWTLILRSLFQKWLAFSAAGRAINRWLSDVSPSGMPLLRIQVHISCTLSNKTGCIGLTILPKYKTALKIHLTPKLPVILSESVVTTLLCTCSSPCPLCFFSPRLDSKGDH
jgi:hypothetical protein